jgi:hypothetical protein
MYLSKTTLIKTFTPRLCRISLAIIAGIGLGACGMSSSKPAANTPAAKPMFTVVALRPAPEASEWITRYLDGVIPMAEKAGMKELHRFGVSRTLAGELKPTFSGMYWWPGNEAAQSVRQSDHYLKNLKPLRLQAWESYMSYDFDYAQLPAFTIDKTKNYTISVAWKKTPEGFDEYFAATQGLRDRLGAKILWRNTPMAFESDNPTDTKPDLIALVEWPSTVEPDEYLAALYTDAYKTFVAEAFARVEWFELGE